MHLLSNLSSYHFSLPPFYQGVSGQILLILALMVGMKQLRDQGRQKEAQGDSCAS
jgi:hypothetical protein